LERQSPFSIEAGASQRRQFEANVNIFDQMTDDEQKVLLAVLQALRDAER
jgi:hypothetical protein